MTMKQKTKIEKNNRMNIIFKKEMIYFYHCTYNDIYFISIIYLVLFFKICERTA